MKQYLLYAGPVSCAHLTCLALCLDAVEATGQVAPTDMARVAEMVAALRKLAYLQPTLDEVALSDSHCCICARTVDRAHSPVLLGVPCIYLGRTYLHATTYIQQYVGKPDKTWHCTEQMLSGKGLTGIGHAWVNTLPAYVQATSCSFLHFHGDLLGALLSEVRPPSMLWHTIPMLHNTT